MLSENPLGSWIFEQIGLSQFLLSSFLTWGAFGLQWRLALERRRPSVAATRSKQRSLLPSMPALFPESSALPEFDS
jgi:hypothetical protein